MNLTDNQCRNTLDKISNNTTLLYIWPPIPPFQCRSEILTQNVFRVGGGRDLLYLCNCFVTDCRYFQTFSNPHLIDIKK